MKKMLLVIFSAFLFHAQGFSQQNFLDTIWSGGIMRAFRVYVPAIYTGQTARPLVLNFHGNGGGNAVNFESMTKFRSVADTANFILVTPNGTLDPQFPQFGIGWNVWVCCQTVDDALFVSNLIDTLAGKYNLDIKRIYATGYSNGAMLDYDLACKLSNKIAAIASVAGTMIESSCNPNRAVPILEIHGTSDQVVPYNGIINGIDTLPAIDSLMKFWVGRDQCAATPTATDIPNTNTGDGSTVKRYVWPNCTGNSSVELLKVFGGGHTWPGLAGANTNRDIIAEREIWRFFSQHTLADGISATTEKPSPLQVTIFPNPASGFLNVSFPYNEAMQLLDALAVADLYGKVLLRKALIPGEIDQQIPLDLGEIPAGVYFLIVETKGHDRMFRRFVVIR